MYALWERVTGRAIESAVRSLARGLVLLVVVAACDSTRPGAMRTDSAGGAEQVALIHSRAPAADAFREAVRAALPGLVFVHVEGVPAAEWPRLGTRPFGAEPSEIPVSSGSGFLLDSAGLILTNSHVVQGAAAVTVVLGDNRRFHATVVGRDPDTDIAVLRIQAGALTPPGLGNSDSLRVGDWVLAMGYPLGLSATVTAGIVSGVGRRLGVNADATGAIAPLEHFIQTDAAINPGNSGGPMVDLAGRVVGINSVILSPTGYYTGYGFAVPINIARRIADDLVRFGEAQRPALGVRIADVSPADAVAFELPTIAGAVVVGVVSGGPAARAGIELGDVMVAVDSTPIATSADLQAALVRRRPGDRIHLRAVRYGSSVEFSLELARLPGRVQEALPLPVAAGTSGPGFSVIEDGGALFVAEVERFSAAARAGLRPGQQILALNRRPLRSLADYRASLNRIGPATVLSLRVVDRTLGETIVNVESDQDHTLR